MVVIGYCTFLGIVLCSDNFPCQVGRCVLQKIAQAVLKITFGFKLHWKIKHTSNWTVKSTMRLTFALFAPGDKSILFRHHLNAAEGGIKRWDEAVWPRLEVDDWAAIITVLIDAEIFANREWHSGVVAIRISEAFKVCTTVNHETIIVINWNREAWRLI